MNYKTHIMKAIKYIEENLKNEITITDCASVSGYSNYHFIRIFKEATGLTPADYIRKRRISEVIKHMCQNVSISELAFEFGFNSKENFTRAFISEHHILPTEYRSSLNSLKLYDAISFETPPFAVEPEIIYFDSFVLTVYKSDVYPPHFWNRYNSRKWSKKLSGGMVCEDYGVSIWNENKLEYYIGIKKENAHGNTEGTIDLEIKGGLYAVFVTPKTSHFDFVNTIHLTWNYIKNEWLPNSEYIHAGSIEFESYLEESHTFSEKIYIPLKEKLK